MSATKLFVVPKRAQARQQSFTTEWKEIGTVSVDGGHIMIVDPCYLRGALCKEILADVEAFHKSDSLGTLGRQLGPFAVVSSIGLGDGSYSVYALHTRDSLGYGRVAGLYIPTSLF